MIDLPIDMNMAHSGIIESRFLVPINARLSTLFGAGFSFATTRRLLHNGTGPGLGVIITILLWILDCWNCFSTRIDPTSTCAPTFQHDWLRFYRT